MKVSQFPLFILDTIRANFHLADPDATDAEIKTVCERTGLWSVLENIAGGQNPLDYVLPRSLDQGLSGGERRLLAITRALVTEPAVLLLDEPTTGIDALGRDMIFRLVRDLGSKVAILVVDHNVREFISLVADDVYVLEQGRITQRGTPDELAEAPGLFQSLYLHGEDRVEEATGKPLEPGPLEGKPLDAKPLEGKPLDGPPFPDLEKGAP